LINIAKMQEMKKPPIILTLLKDYGGIFRTSKCRKWLNENSQLMPNYGCNLFSDLDTMYASVGMASQEFRNVNMVVAGKPASDLILEGYEDAIGTFVSCKYTLTNLINRNAADTTVSRLAGCAPSWGRPQQQERSNGGGAPAHNKPNKDRQRPTETNRASDPKRPRTGAALTSEVPSYNRTERGFVYLKDPGMSISQILPANMAADTKPCAKFICKGLECTHPGSTCPHGKHAFNPKFVPKVELAKMADHFHANKHGWFDSNVLSRVKEHFEVAPNLLAVGDRRGPRPLRT